MAHCYHFGDPLTTNLLFLFILGLHHQTSRWFIITSPFMLRTQEALIAFMGRPPFLVGDSPVFTYIHLCDHLVLRLPTFTTIYHPYFPHGLNPHGNNGRHVVSPGSPPPHRADVRGSVPRLAAASPPRSLRRRGGWRGPNSE